MYGELGIRPWELAKMTFREVILSITGLRERDKMQQQLLKRATFIIASSGMNGKAVMDKAERLWPIPGEGVKRKGNERALKMLEKFREAEAVKRANEKING